MSYEAGSKECRRIIETKENLLMTMQSLKNIAGTDELMKKLKLIYDELEKMHEKRKSLENYKDSI